MNNWVVYIVECGDKTYYTGITNNLEKRIRLHQKGKAARYTAQRLPVILRYSKDGYSQSEARREEITIKDWSRKEKDQLISGLIRR